MSIRGWRIVNVPKALAYRDAYGDDSALHNRRSGLPRLPRWNVGTRKNEAKRSLRPNEHMVSGNLNYTVNLS